MRGKNKELRALVRVLRNEGWSIHQRSANNGHLYATHPNANRSVTLSFNPGNRNSMKALRNKLRKAIERGDEGGG